jgi:hypothetical protein
MASRGCQICYRPWNSLANQQIEIAITPDQASNWEPGEGSKDGGDFHGIRATREFSNILFKCRNTRGGYATLLNLALETDYGNTYWSISTDKTSTTTASEESLDVIRMWLHECTSGHEQCNSSRPDAATLPTRLVQIRPQLRLIAADGLPADTHALRRPEPLLGHQTDLLSQDGHPERLARRHSGREAAAKFSGCDPHHVQAGGQLHLDRLSLHCARLKRRLAP